MLSHPLGYLLAATLLAVATSSLTAQPAVYPGKVGVEVGADLMFTDLAKTLRPWGSAPDCGSGTVPTDAQFWPTSDACTVLFDNRPFAAWLGPSNIDDPEQYQPDWGGTYRLAFTGQAVLTLTTEHKDGSVANQMYDPVSNTTTADLIVPHATGLMVLSLTNTQRTVASAANTGFTGLRVMRPGFGLDTDQVFMPQFLDSMEPFRALRFMEITGTNNSNPMDYNLPVAQNSVAWTDRNTPAEATQQQHGNPGRRAGLAWEYVIQIANLTGKDIWINVPVAATDEYVTNLAQLIQSNLSPGLNVYIEHSNEVWNSSFSQYTWNKTAAQTEVAAGGSNLNNDGSTDPDVWARRRHARRLREIALIFQNVFGTGQLLTRIRPVYASFTLDLGGAFFGQVLNWVQQTYGAPNQFFYAMAKTGYFGSDVDSATESVDALIAGYQTASGASAPSETAPLKAIAASYGLPLFAYEGGPGYDVSGNTVNIANRIESARDSRMHDTVFNHLAKNWYPVGGDLFMYFAHSRKVSRYGDWGAIEDLGSPVKMRSPKYLALLDLTQANSNPGQAASVSAAYGLLSGVAPASLVSAYGPSLAASTTVASSTPLPSRLAQTSVAVTDSAGVTRLAPLLFVSPAQINYVLPSETAVGAGSVTVYTGLGLPVTGAINVQNIVPALISRDGTGSGLAAAQLFYPDGTVVDACTFMGLQCVAVPIDLTVHGGLPVLVLYATGLRNHIGAVTCSVHGVPSPVQYAGAQGGFVGLDQVNVVLSLALAGTGDGEVTVAADGATSNTVHLAFK